MALDSILKWIGIAIVVGFIVRLMTGWRLDVSADAFILAVTPAIWVAGMIIVALHTPKDRPSLVQEIRKQPVGLVVGGLLSTVVIAFFIALALAGFLGVLAIPYEEHFRR